VNPKRKHYVAGSPYQARLRPETCLGCDPFLKTNFSVKKCFCGGFEETSSMYVGSLERQWERMASSFWLVDHFVQSLGQF